MSNEPGQPRASKRVHDASERARAADEQVCDLLQPSVAARLDEADELILALRKLGLIAPSSRPDRRSIAFAAATLRGELSGQAAEQASLFGLNAKALRRLRDDWVNDKDTRLRQALSYCALSATERAAFLADPASLLSQEELAERDASKRQRRDEGAHPNIPAPQAPVGAPN